VRQEKKEQDDEWGFQGIGFLLYRKIQLSREGSMAISGWAIDGHASFTLDRGV
jgi:hypothetical protein